MPIDYPTDDIGQRQYYERPTPGTARRAWDVFSEKGCVLKLWFERSTTWHGVRGWLAEVSTAGETVNFVLHKDAAARWEYPKRKP